MDQGRKEGQGATGASKGFAFKGQGLSIDNASMADKGDYVNH
jgi:hypothetical protein